MRGKEQPVKRASAASRTKKTLNLKESRQVAFALLTAKAWTSRELLLRLRRRGAPEELAALVIADLERQGYLNDDAYAHAWVEGRARHRHLGARRLRLELARKGVPRPLIDAAVEKTFAADGGRAEALRAAQARWPSLQKRHPDKAARRLQQYLLRKGFSAELALSIVKQIARSVDVQSDV